MKKFIILLGLTLMITPFIFGQSPNSFKYQAVVRNSSNEIISDQAVGVQVSILIENASGSEVYSETHTVTTSQLGLINLNIGDGSSSDDFLSIDWGSGSYFVKIAIDVNGGSDYIEMGTSQLLSVPYSLYAKTAGKIISSDSSKWIYNKDNIYYNKGFVGIGDTVPASPLSIKYEESNIAYATNTSLFSLDRTVGSSSSKFYIFGYPDNDNLPDYMKKSIMLYSTGDADNLKLFSPKTIQFSIADWIHESGEIMRLTSDGCVGVGTITPSAKFHVSGGNVYVENGNVGIGTLSPSEKFHVSNGNAYFDNIDKGNVKIGFEGSSTPIEMNYTDETIGYATNTTLLSLNRQVGASTATFNIFGYPNTTDVPEYMRKSVMLYATHDADNLKLFSPKTIQFSIADWINESGEIMRLTSDGYVGIGTTIPKAKLHIKNGDIYLENIGNGIIMKSPDGQCWRITIDNNGDFQKASVTCPEDQ